MTSSIRPASSGLRSLVAVAAVGAVALSTYLAPIATAATNVDPDGTVTVTADPAPPAPAAAPAETAPVPATTDSAAVTSSPKPSTTTPGRATTTTTGVATATTTPKPSACSTATPAAPWRLVAARSLDDPTSAKVEWAGVACATRYNVSVFVDGKDSVDVVPAPETSYSLSSLDSDEDLPDPGQQPQRCRPGRLQLDLLPAPGHPGQRVGDEGHVQRRQGRRALVEGARSHHSPELPAQGHSCGRPEAGHRRRGGRRPHRVRTRRPRRPRHVRHHPPADQQGR